jgi:hypothetical protein
MATDIDCFIHLSPIFQDTNMFSTFVVGDGLTPSIPPSSGFSKGVKKAPQIWSVVRRPCLLIMDPKLRPPPPPPAKGRHWVC